MTEREILKATKDLSVRVVISGLDEIHCGFVVFDDVLRGFSVF